MHKSRLCGFIIDCRTTDLEPDANFWGRALGHEVLANDPQQDTNPNYRLLKTDLGEPRIELQRVEHQSRVHLDIETDDVEAETRRLEKLGARRIEPVKDWWVMQAPSGHRFCVVPALAADFAENANVWSDVKDRGYERKSSV